MLNLTFEQKIKLYDTIIWTCLAGIVIWLILKVAGVIHTPVIITYFPAFLGVVSFGILLTKLGLYLGTITTQFRYALKRLDTIETRLDVIEVDIKDLKKAEQLNTRFRLKIGGT